jgi:Fic family protein
MIHYLRPTNWIAYDSSKLLNELVAAKAAVWSLGNVPYQKRWVENLQKMELKREVAGTSRIEGAEFTTREIDRVMTEETPDELYTRSQRQAAAALEAYKWIKTISDVRVINEQLILEIHRKMVTGADDDHCEPGVLRGDGQNVIFGNPAHRGVDGGPSAASAFKSLVDAINNEFGAHDELIQAIAAHYHIAAMHPFLDGNGRTARALEALMLRRAGLRDSTFIAMSNYYYEEKATYLATLGAVRERQNDLTPFLRFALRGIELQAKRLLAEIQRDIKRELFRTMTHDLFARMPSARKRVIGDRQRNVLTMMLDEEILGVNEFIRKILPLYAGLKSDYKALIRDVNGLLELKALEFHEGAKKIAINLDWPSQITETEFFEKVRKMPTAQSVNWYPK